jgi:DNA polymerase-1
MKVLIIDGNNFLFRGAFAVAVKHRLSSNGIPTYGIKGFMNMLIGQHMKFRPTHIVVAFDKGGKPNWRKKLYPEYKEGEARVKQRNDPKFLEIISQMPDIQDLVYALGLRISMAAGVEADDIIGTLALRFSNKGAKVLISSTDKDMAQLVTSKVHIVDSKGSVLTPAGIESKFGVKPNQIVDYLTLIGDGADNIPGVYKCGPKTAAKLLSQYGTLDEVIANKKEAMTPNMLKNFEDAEPDFEWTPELLTIKTDLNLSTTLDNCKIPYHLADPDLFYDICEELDLIQTQKQLLSAFHLK